LKRIYNIQWKLSEIAKFKYKQRQLKDLPPDNSTVVKNNLTLYTYSNTPSFSLDGIKCFARIVNVKDGDTVDAVIPFEGKFYKFTVRLKGIDTHEMKSQDPGKRQKAIQARNRLLQLIGVTTPFDIDTQFTRTEIKELCKKDLCIVWLNCFEFEKYGRLIADIYPNVDTPMSFSELLIKERHAVPYDGGTKIL
jgi:endonuclease YncB( thermonuclease family)